MSRKRPEKKGISQEWLTTYSDMVTLILTFFVLLYSFSLVDNKKFQALASSLANALGGGAQALFEYNQNSGKDPITGDTNPAGSDNKNENDDEETDSAGKLYNDVVNFVEQNDLNASVTIKKNSQGIIIEFKDRILFDSGEAELKSEGIPILKKIGTLIAKLPNEIVVEGHTDNVPIHTASFPSNWELSSGRALRVLSYFTDSMGMPSKRFSAVAYGEYRPIASNATVGGRAQNRRVNVLILTEDEVTVQE
jgi:chemotaxis protein MotB